MANWAALQEQLTGKRVVKRAKHSIHFDNGNGSITANFSGKPCHFQDTDGLWKPIDTGLLLAGDGWYGSPHSDVKIHKDGRVKVGGYQQKSTLVNAKEGVVDGDKIVREFKFGTQYLYMTENGFRQETVIDRTPTTAEAKYLIASESGTLDSKYKRSDITAVDADGDVHEFINLGQFKKWLDGAVYPVTIDPDFAATADNIVISSYKTTSWSDAQTIATSAFVGGATTTVGTRKAATPAWYCYRPLIKFDTSTIGSGSTVTQVNLKMVATLDNSTGDFDVQIVKYDWSAYDADRNNTTRNTAFNGVLTGTADDAIWRNTNGMSTNTQYTSGNLATAWVSKTGTTYYGLRSDMDFTNTEPPTADLYSVVLATEAHATESYRPVLSVTYTTGSTGTLRRTNMNAQMQSLAGGMNG